MFSCSFPSKRRVAHPKDEWSFHIIFDKQASSTRPCNTTTTHHHHPSFPNKEKEVPDQNNQIIIL
jgi:hypothetical protein